MTVQSQEGGLQCDSASVCVIFPSIVITLLVVVVEHFVALHPQDHVIIRS